MRLRSTFREVLIVLALLCIPAIAALTVTGCNAGSLDKAAVYAAAVQAVQMLVGTDYQRWAASVNEQGGGRWTIPTTLTEGTEFFRSLYVAFNDAKGTATSQSMSVAGVVAKVQTPDGSGEDLLKAFHAQPR